MAKISYSSGGVRRNRPKMVRQNHIDIDSDSSESKSHLLPWNTNTLPLPSKKHKERLARDVSLTYSISNDGAPSKDWNWRIFSQVTSHQLKKAPLVKEIVKKEDSQKIKDKNSSRSSRHRKSSLVVHPDQLPILRVNTELGITSMTRINVKLKSKQKTWYSSGQKPPSTGLVLALCFGP